MLLRTLCITMTLVAGVPALASDTGKEKRWAEQIVDALLDGEPVWLEAGQDRFLGIYTAAEAAAPKGALIVAHGIGVHPDWDQVVKPIRVEMTTRGWSTLSIQMPILRNEATAEEYVPLFDEAAPRIDAAIGFLHGQGIKTIVIAAHSMGGNMSAFYLSQHPDSPVAALIAVGMNAAQRNERVNTARSLERIRIPVLDLYGGDDLPAVLDTATLRDEAARKAGNSKYRQQVVSGAGHFFDGKNEELLSAVESWLRGLGY
ncbi:MAG: alpha/beta hydrolase family protein [Gammaproteobacteria bacterium]|nr:alpha/beta hydrolase family protein [Gammaproteobacteria bacterium]